MHDALAEAVDELWRGGRGGDILIFLPGEREIREAADHLRKHAAHAFRGPPIEVVPLFARLSQAEQDKVFEPSQGRRIVLATNVAETSLTVPGIRYVIDTGVARVKRYSYRNKVEQLQVEAVSQAAANQRAGRCGRVADGVCIRLYEESDFLQRGRFTTPEILRSSLAGVILRMKSLRLGDVEDFPFLEAPPRKAIADGYELLHELGAVDEARQLTPVGMSLARLPLDPRLGRMILAAQEHHCLDEVLIIAAALSVQDVRDRPLEQQQAADEKHKRFDDERSEFNGYLKLWRWIEEGRGVHGHARAAGAALQPVVDSPKLSHRQQEHRLREHFVSPRRVREWRDIHAQLHTVAAEHGWRLNASPATYEQTHLALLSGLLGNLGCKSDDEDWYLGARGIKFWRHPGSHLSKKPGRWIVAAELIETTRLFARGIAAIDVAWLPRVAGHLLKLQRLEPHWEKKAAEVIALERATLHGLVIYHSRRVNFGKLDPQRAREIFIREALVAGEWDTPLPFMGHNRRMIRDVQALEHKTRRQDVLVDDGLIEAFYDAHVPHDVVSGASMERWHRQASKAQPKLLMLDRDDLMRHQAAGVTSTAYPATIRLGGIDCGATYLHEPGDARDGVTVTVPIYALNQVQEERCDWLVPGMLPGKVLALLKSLPQRPRSRLVPLPAFADAFVAEAAFAQGPLMDALVGAVREHTQLAVQRQDFKFDQLSAHHWMNLRIVDEHGRQLGMGRHLPALKSELGAQARGAFQALAALKVPASTAGKAAPSVPQATQGMPRPQEQRPAKAPTTSTSTPPATPSAAQPPASAASPAPPAPLTAWTFGSLPELLEVKRGTQVMVGFPALIDRQTHVEIEVFDEPDVATRQHRHGLRRLFALALKEPLKFVEKNLPDFQAMSMAYMPLGSAEELRAQIIEVALNRAFLQAPWPTDADSFQQRLEEGRKRLSLIAQEVARVGLGVLVEHQAATRKLKDTRGLPAALQEDVQAQLQGLVGKGFLSQTPWQALQHLPRYLKAVVVRLDKWRVEPERDAQKMQELRPLVQRHQRKVSELKGVHDGRLEEYRWLLEELRVSFFAQALRTPTPVSAKRLDKAWALIVS